MSFESGDDAAFDLETATNALLDDGRDLQTLLNVLAQQLEPVFNGRLKLERHGGLLRRSKAIKALELRLGGFEYRIQLEEGVATCTLVHSSGGVRLKTEQLEPAVWLKRMLEQVQAEAAHNQAARRALEQVVLGR